MTLEEWNKLTPAQAAKRIGAAHQSEQRAARIWNASGLDADERIWERAFAYWENLRVLAICGVRAKDPYVMENE